MADLGEIIENYGFESEAELHRLVASVDINNAKALAAFENWKINNGTKAGLLALMGQKSPEVIKETPKSSIARNPYFTSGPTAIQFSMGRSSGLMAEQVMQAHDGKRPQDTIFFVENTGKEDELSLKFADDCDKRWGLGLIWLEYTEGGGYKQVTYETASRNGEPFEAVIRQRGGVLPNPRSRYCSSELKTRTVHRFIRNELGWQEWDTLLGIRADEPSRISKFRTNPHPETKSETIVIPLAEAKVTAKDVGKFWSKNSFDLGLPNMNGKTMHGNCDLCFLKPARQVVSLIQEKPARAIWWAKQEKEAESVAHGSGNRFRNDRPSYAQMLNFTDRQGDMFDPNEQAISCFCGD